MINFVLASLVWVPNAMLILSLVFSMGSPVRDGHWACADAADTACAAVRAAPDALEAGFCGLRREQWRWTKPKATLVAQFDLVCRGERAARGAGADGQVQRGWRLQCPRCVQVAQTRGDLQPHTRSAPPMLRAAARCVAGALRRAALLTPRPHAGRPLGAHCSCVQRPAPLCPPPASHRQTPGRPKPPTASSFWATSSAAACLDRCARSGGAGRPRRLAGFGTALALPAPRGAHAPARRWCPVFPIPLCPRTGPPVESPSPPSLRPHQLSDRYGRKGCLLLAAGLSALFPAASLACNSYWEWLAMRLLSGIGAAGTALTSYILATEPIGEAWRGAAGIATQGARRGGSVCLGKRQWSGSGAAPS